MPINSDEYRARLINSILFANSHDEVKRYIGTMTREFEQNKIGGHFTDQFVDSVSEELDSFTPMNKDAQQWSNIQLARVLFRRIRRHQSEPF